ncbi:MAG: Rieske 2Fe-2S domain-containing protein [Pseudomonadales bacterium]
MLEPKNPNRRKLLLRLVQGFSITGLGFLAYPFFKVLMPGLSEDGFLEIDYQDLAIGEWKSVSWLGRTVIIFKRGVGWTKAVGSSVLKDPLSKTSVQPKFAENAERSHRDDVFVFYSNCTHLGCEVAIHPEQSAAPIQCPCHQSRFDGAGRVFAEAVASRNLEVPFYRPIAANAIRLERVTPSDGIG